MSLSEELDKLAQLHRQGILSGDEFARAKAGLIGTTRQGGPEAGVNRLNSWRRSRADRWIGGVCGGLAELTGVHSWIWRVVFVVSSACAGTGVALYLLLWFFVPDAGDGIGPSRHEPA